MSSSQRFTAGGGVHARHRGVGDGRGVGGSTGVPARRPDVARASIEPVFGIVTALPEEFAAVWELLDDIGDASPVPTDPTRYVVGSMPSRDPHRPHPVVLTLLGETGDTAAANACANLCRGFPSVTAVIMSGIACGVPAPDRPTRHVRLGDIVVASWGIAGYDGTADTDESRWSRWPFPLPSALLVRLAKHLEAVESTGRRPWETSIERALQALPAYARPDEATDLVYAADDPDRIVPHPPREITGHRPGTPKVHHGRIGSATRQLRSARARDAVALAEGLIAFEMEGKGLGSGRLVDGIDWFMVRGISDYGDARTGTRWRGYASVVAAAYIRALLAQCLPLHPHGHTPADTPRYASRTRSSSSSAAVGPDSET